MKGGVAALVVAAEAAARRREWLQGDLVFCATSDEENGCNGAEALAREPLFAEVGAALVAEPSSLGLILAEKGAFWVEARFSGKTAHASMPEYGANAIVAAAEFVAGLEGAAPHAGPEHAALGRPTLSVGTIHGGVRPNVVPDRCSVVLDMRTVPGSDHAGILRRVREAAQAVAARRGGIGVEVEARIDRLPVACDAEHPLADAVSDAVTAVTGERPSPRGVPYFTEACIWAPVLGLPCVICGPGDPRLAHQPDEHVEVRQLEQAAAIYARAAGRMLGDPA
jgi:succinyl-diaminopimelate desuccinylase